jgi:DNA-binding XRE family transcriptional regulator
MAKARTRDFRAKSNATLSLGRTRPTRKASGRKRPTPKYLPKKLRLIRERVEMSQSEIARALDVADRSTISGYERGEREPPLPILLKYARLVGISTDVLIDDKLKLPD